jgi:hypothetical protein
MLYAIKNGKMEIRKISAILKNFPLWLDTRKKFPSIEKWINKLILSEIKNNSRGINFKIAKNENPTTIVPTTE